MKQTEPIERMHPVNIPPSVSRTEGGFDFSNQFVPKGKREE
jgi:hypothetical protein